MEMEKAHSDGGSDIPPSSNLQSDSHGVDNLDSSCSTPYASAPSSPGRGPLASFFYSAPSSPMHFILSSSASLSHPSPPPPSAAADLSSEFDFSSSFPPSTASVVGSMTSADELFHNGRIRPMELSSHLQSPQAVAPQMDLEEEEDDSKAPERVIERGRDSRLRSRSVNRRARSMSPKRKSPFEWQGEQEDREERGGNGPDQKQSEEMEASTASTTPSGSASTSRSSSGKGSKRWISLKDFLYRSKSEGRGNGKEKFWHTLSFSPSSSSREKKSTPSETTARGEKEKQKGRSQLPPKGGKGTANGGSKRRGPAPSPHEAFYTANRAQAEEMKKKTFLPYRQGLLGCLGFSSKSYGALNGFAKTLNPIPST